MIDTLYVGGGTPSLLEPRFIGGLAGVIGRERLANPELEWTVEANPESFGERTAVEWAAAGVNRISFGVQSFDPAALKWMGRLHSPADARAAVKNARAAGVDEPVRRSDFWASGQGAAFMGGRYRARPGARRAARIAVRPHGREGDPPPPRRQRGPRVNARRGIGTATNTSSRRTPWQMPGTSTTKSPTSRCRASLRGTTAPAGGERRTWVWGTVPTVTGGARRWWNERDWAAYAERVKESGRAVAGEEVLSDRQVRLEALWLGLRTGDGLEEATLGGVGPAGGAPLGSPPGGLRAPRAGLV